MIDYRVLEKKKAPAVTYLSPIPENVLRAIARHRRVLFLPARFELHQISDPFWINAKDEVYLNASFRYQPKVMEIIARRIRRYRTSVPLKFKYTTPHCLAGQGIQVSDGQLKAFGAGTPLWRRGAMSVTKAKPGRRRSGLHMRLRKALLSWTVVCESFIRHAIKIERDDPNSPFRSKWPESYSNARDIVQYALGYKYFEDPKSKLNKHINFGIPSVGIEHVDLGEVALGYGSAYLEGRTRCFQGFFFDQPKQISRCIKRELQQFKAHGRAPGLKFDAWALARWAVWILIHLNIARESVRQAEEQRNNWRRALRNTPDAAERELISEGCNMPSENFLHAFIGRDEATGRDEEDVYIRLRDIVGLQEMVLIAFVADIDPYSLDDTASRCGNERNQQAMIESLFAAARWLGVLFRQRRALLSVEHAASIRFVMKVHKVPPGWKAWTEEWSSAVKTITSFLSAAEIAALLDCAKKVLQDGRDREIVATDCCAENVKAGPRLEFGHKKYSLRIKAGRIILPGDYDKSWFGEMLPSSSTAN